LDSLALVIEAPGHLALRQLGLLEMQESDILVATEWSGVSTGTERLLWQGRMPSFPGLGYPLVPGYETVGRVVDAGALVRGMIGSRVFVPGANCYVDARGLFGGAAGHLVLPAARAIPVGEMGREAVLLALAATARRAVCGGALPDLIVGHGVLGRLAARITVALGGAPTVWEIDSTRQAGGDGYHVVHPGRDTERNYATILDVSGDSGLIEGLIGRLTRGGEVVLAGFYDQVAFGFADAFRREARLRISAEFRPDDLVAVLALLRASSLRLDGLITHTRSAAEAEEAYPQAFADSQCLKMVLDWREIG
jgi:3-hydroxyethyl bacteriochlorophyllide a dehydrogenase